MIKMIFRDPKRITPKDAKMVSPSDGRIIYIKEIKNGEVPISVKGKINVKIKDIVKANIRYNNGILIGIFLSPWDVHYQRSPISGKVKDVLYYKTNMNYSMIPVLIRNILRIKSFKVFRYLCNNERNVIHIQNKDFDCFVIQIADKVVNKIECYVKKENSVEKSQKIGMIKRGSQVDLFIPNIKLSEFKLLKERQKVFAGETKFI